MVMTARIERAFMKRLSATINGKEVYIILIAAYPPIPIIAGESRALIGVGASA